MATGTWSRCESLQSVLQGHCVCFDFYAWGEGNLGRDEEDLREEEEEGDGSTWSPLGAAADVYSLLVSGKKILCPLQLYLC